MPDDAPTPAAPPTAPPTAPPAAPTPPEAEAPGALPGPGVPWAAPPQDPDPHGTRALIQAEGGWPRGAINAAYLTPLGAFDRDPKYQPTWNWSAFLFGALWYLYQGMWLKAIAYFVLAGIVGYVTDGALIISLGIWVLFGLAANYDLWLWRRHRTQLWDRS